MASSFWYSSGLARRLLTRSFDQPTFWPDDVSLRNSLDASTASRLHGHRQVADFHLAALASRRGGRLATFDGRLQRSLAGTLLIPAVALVA